MHAVHESASSTREISLHVKFSRRRFEFQTGWFGVAQSRANKAAVRSGNVMRHGGAARESTQNYRIRLNRDNQEIP
jgi:hypothetical protein